MSLRIQKPTNMANVNVGNAIAKEVLSDEAKVIRQLYIHGKSHFRILKRLCGSCAD